MASSHETSNRTSNLARAERRAQVLAACNHCRVRKIRCNASRPVCEQCRSRGLNCAYATRDVRETRQQALRREQGALTSKLQKYEELVNDLVSVPGKDALAILKSHRHTIDFNPSPDIFHAEPPRGFRVPDHGILAQPLLQPPLTPLSPNLQADLMVNHSKAYPKILAFENPQSIARSLLDPSGSHRLEDIVRMKLDIRASGPANHSQSRLLCDPRLQSLDISYWTEVQISSAYATAAISHYLQTDHPTIALFDSGLFVSDLVGKRTSYCSRFLVNAILAYTMQAYEIFDPFAWELRAMFYAEAMQLWHAEKYRNTYTNLAALKLMDFAAVTSGFDLEARRLTLETEQLAQKLGLSGTSLHAIPKYPSHELRWKSHAAWGYFTSTCISNLLYMRPLPKPPLSYPIPGTSDLHLPWYMGSTFTSLCKLYVIAERALSHCTGTETIGQVPFHIVQQAFEQLLEWVTDLPGCCARTDVSPHHVMNLHVYYHCLVILLVRPWTAQDLRFASRTLHSTPSAVFHASIRQLKHMVVLYQLHYPQARYHPWWNPGVIYVLHEVLTSVPVDPEWRFYFLICLQAYRHLALAYPFAAISYKATLTMAMAEEKLTGSKARDLHRQLVHRKDRARVREPQNLRAYMDLGHERKANGSGDVEGLAGDFDRLALMRDGQPGSSII